MTSFTRIILHDTNDNTARPLLHERERALHDLRDHGVFRPVNDTAAPYDVALSIEESRLIVRIRNAEDTELPMLVLSLQPYRRLIRDYFLMIEGHEQARRESHHSRLQTIDMARRGLHNEGAELLIERLQGKIDMDFDTARLFFTLICSLHQDKNLLR
jgi:uncharacterized protein (UPF0262 family)